jgi:hypothetical protein
MSSKRVRRLLSMSLALILALQSVAAAGPFDSCCPCTHCPPCYRHCMEGHPKIWFKKGCPKPICNPCSRPNWGYFQPCWNPWPWPPDWSHCPVQPPASTVQITPTHQPAQESAPPATPEIRPGY